MSFFKKRSNAILLTVVIIILSTVFGIHRSLGEKMQEVSDTFSSGVYFETEGHTKPSIARQLDERCKSSLLLITAGSRYSEAQAETNALRESRNRLFDLLSEKSLRPSELYKANEELTANFDRLYSTLQSIGTDEPIGDYQNKMVNTARLIENSGYNEYVLEFNRKTLNIFPTNFLKILAFVSEPELYE